MDDDPADMLRALDAAIDAFRRRHGPTDTGIAEDAFSVGDMFLVLGRIEASRDPDYRAATVFEIAARPDLVGLHGWKWGIPLVEPRPVAQSGNNRDVSRG